MIQIKLQDEEKILLSAVTNTFNENGIDLNDYVNSFNELDWNYLINVATLKGLAPFVYKNLSQSIMPKNVYSHAIQVYYKTLSRGIILHNALNNVLSEYKANNIEVIVLKGAFLSEWLYEDLGLRQFSDIDLLVSFEDGEKCINILSNLGFVATDSNITSNIGKLQELVHYTPMVKDEVSFEIHVRLHRESKKYNLNSTKLIERSQLFNLNGVHLKGLELYDLIIYLCIHLDKHFGYESVQFTSFNDIVLILNRHNAHLDWNLLVNRARVYKCDDVLFRFLNIVNYFYFENYKSIIPIEFLKIPSISDQNLFLLYFRGQKVDYSVTTQHIANIKNSNNVIDIAKYLLDVIFPPKHFMIVKYEMKNDIVLKYLWLLWYPYRWWKGFKGLFRV